MVKKIQYEEVEKHKTKDDCWMTIDGKVYDVTKFLVEHPGGEEVMLEVAGGDATDSFEDIGHSQSARDMLDKYLIGEVEGVPVKASKKSSAAGGAQGGGGMGKLLIPVVIVGAVAFLMKNYM